MVKFLFSCLCLSLLLSRAAFALTESELAAKTQTPLKTNQIKTLQEQCPVRLQDAHEVVGPVRYGKLSTQSFLLLAEYMPGEDSRTEGKIRAFDLLPNGGIGAQDICGYATIHVLAGTDSKKPSLFISLRLRPGLEVAQHYPTAYSQIKTQDQLLKVGARLWISVPSQSPIVTSSIIKKHIGHPLIDMNSPALEIDGVLYLPLKPEHSF